jgi:hypothetical protein
MPLTAVITLAGVDDDPNLGVLPQLDPRICELVPHAAFMALSWSGRLFMSQPTGACRSTFRC